MVIFVTNANMLLEVTIPNTDYVDLYVYANTWADVYIAKSVWMNGNFSTKECLYLYAASPPPPTTTTTTTTTTNKA